MSKFYSSSSASSTNIQFSFISSPQNLTNPVSLTISSSSTDLTGSVYLYSNMGPVAPMYVEMSDGYWSGNIALFAVGKRSYFMLRWNNKTTGESIQNVSNEFDVTDQNGDISQNAKLSGTITDSNSTAIINAAVSLYSSDPSGSFPITANYTTYTNIVGQYLFNNAFPGNYYILVQPICCYRNVTREISLAAKVEVNEDFSLDSLCPIGVQGVTVPVLLVPGIMGSRIKTFWSQIYPELEFITSKWDSGKLKLHDPYDKAGWDNLKNDLYLKRGYMPGCTLFDVPYDWSLPIEVIRDAYLIPWINQAKKISKSDQVDIVAHSMGGLVTRAYLQSNEYAKDVRKFAMVTPPNKGSDRVYFIWEGGDPILADLTTTSTEDNNGIFGLGSYFYTKTLNRLHETRNLEQVCKISSGTPSKCDNKKLYDFIRADGRSSGQLMPIYDDALLNVNTDNNVLISSSEENTFLRALNSLPCRNVNGCVNRFGNLYNFTSFSSIMDKVQVKIFVGTGIDTVQSVFVTPQSTGYLGWRYKDGIPTVKPKPINIQLSKEWWFKNSEGHKGDGTVPATSAIFPDSLSKEFYMLKEAKHGEAIQKYKSEIVKFISDKQFLTKDLDYKNSEEDKLIQLSISIDGRAEPFVLGPNNTHVGKNFFSTYSAGVVIDNPENGNYSIAIVSPYKESYQIEIRYINFYDEISVSTRNIGYTDGRLTGFTLTISNGVLEPIIFDKSFNVPTNLEMNNLEGKIQLTWNASVSQDTDHFEIYWRPDNEPYFQFLGKTAQFSYLTNHDWSDAESSVYICEEVFKSGNTSFFSDTTFYIENMPEPTPPMPTTTSPVSSHSAWEYVGYVETAILGVSVVIGGCAIAYYGKTHGWCNNANADYEPV
jgi:pimeloyl-ACP methyl ester carboxylesterase